MTTLSTSARTVCWIFEQVQAAENSNGRQTARVHSDYDTVKPWPMRGTVFIVGFESAMLKS